MSVLTFTVYGIPAPQGSMRAFIPKGWKRAVLTSANKRTKPWRQEVAGAALAAMERAKFEQAGKSVAFQLCVSFRFQKPKSAKKSVTQKVTKPDLDKLLRSVLDALTGIVWVDDSQVVIISARKDFGQPGATITFSEMDDLPPGKALKHEAINDSELPF
jgi:Holliday junction resolvase RusA-like endonuclease